MGRALGNLRALASNRRHAQTRAPMAQPDRTWTRALSRRTSVAPILVSRWARWLAAVVFAVVVALTPRSGRAASDPTLVWSTIETEHFRVTYHSGCERAAARIADTSEGIHETMVATLGWRPRDKTEILVTDLSESANGAASALPYNAIRLIVTAPDDLSPLADVDDWYLELQAHEYTHVLHIDQIRGIPALVNAILGKTLATNQVQPRWIIEGIGVHNESARTSGGRLRGSVWDMYMRTDVLENNIATLDRMSNTVRRWPQGNLFYLYGSYFIRWLNDRYGEEVTRRISKDYGTQLIPWGFNRSIRRATGLTYEELYPLWIADMREQYARVAADVKKKGVREGRRLTHHGQIARSPRWVPGNAWAGHAGDLVYYRDDLRTRTGFYLLPLTRDAAGRVTGARDTKGADPVARTNGESFATFGPDGAFVFHTIEVYKGVISYNDLSFVPPGKRSAFGPDGGRVRLTHAARAAEPAVSPDGRRVVYVVNRGGTRTLHIGDLTPTGVTNARPLVASLPFEQAFTPRWSPDGTRVAYSVWKVGGLRDVRIVDTRDGRVQEIFTDRAQDGGPSFSADGRYLYFHSDRTGIANVYAWDLEAGRALQVTNVLTGAYYPEPSPDGRTLAYVGYSKDGFDVFAMDLDPRAWTPAAPYVDTHPPMPQIPRGRRYEAKPYNPWRTLIPRRYGVQITPGNFGQAAIITASASDLTGLHSVALSSTTELERPEIQGSLAYSYGRERFDFSASAFRSIAPRGGFALGSYRPIIVTENAGVATSVSYADPGPFDTRAYSLGYSFSRVGAEIPLPQDKLDPYETPSFPSRGFIGSLNLAFSYTNAERYLYSVGPERGYSTSLVVNLTDPALASDFSGVVATADFTSYYLMPWLRHHSLALHFGGGTSGGQYPGRGAFFTGGFVDLPVIDTVRNTLIQGGLVLRGYAPVAQSGRSFALANAEYRFPIVNLDRGPSTLPIFLNRINGAAFIDYGSAFDDFGRAAFKTGVGGELWFDIVLGYVLGLTMRTGYARGLASQGLDKLYFVAAVPY